MSSIFILSFIHGCPIKILFGLSFDSLTVFSLSTAPVCSVAFGSNNRLNAISPLLCDLRSTPLGTISISPSLTSSVLPSGYAKQSRL
jgi:hypothetical protein